MCLTMLLKHVGVARANFTAPQALGGTSLMSQTNDFNLDTPNDVPRAKFPALRCCLISGLISDVKLFLCARGAQIAINLPLIETHHSSSIHYNFSHRIADPSCTLLFLTYIYHSWPNSHFNSMVGCWFLCLLLSSLQMWFIYICCSSPSLQLRNIANKYLLLHTT